jgi:uncharacterized surface protein with fasciclin (FAS1) repeats
MSALSVVSVADRAGFHIFASALRASNYFESLEGVGPFTVFAPTDAAFNALGPAALDKLLSRESERTGAFLGYHFAAGKVVAAQFRGRRIRAVMKAGGDAVIEGRDGLRVNAAQVCKPDLHARNGVVHGIDAVLWRRNLDAAA